MVGTRSLSSGAHSRDPVALPTLQFYTFKPISAPHVPFGISKTRHVVVWASSRPLASVMRASEESILRHCDPLVLRNDGFDANRKRETGQGHLVGGQLRKSCRAICWRRITSLVGLAGRSICRTKISTASSKEVAEANDGLFLASFTIIPMLTSGSVSSSGLYAAPGPPRLLSMNKPQLSSTPAMPVFGLRPDSAIAFARAATC